MPFSYSGMALCFVIFLEAFSYPSVYSRGTTDVWKSKTSVVQEIETLMAAIIFPFVIKQLEDEW